MFKIGETQYNMTRDNTTMYLHPDIFQAVDHFFVSDENGGGLYLFRQAFPEDQFDVVALELGITEFDAVFRHEPNKTDIDNLMLLNLKVEDAQDLEDDNIEQMIGKAMLELFPDGDILGS